MKKIRAKQNVVINSMTLTAGQETPVFDEKILESPEVKKALQEGKIEIIDEGPAQPVTDTGSQV